MASLLAMATRRLLRCRLAIASCAFLFWAMAANAAALVQEFYLPMPEAQIYQALSTIEGGIGSAQSSTYSIIVTGNGTVIYYDQWEDGYEIDLSHPTQSTTQIWGDGNDAHGIPPGFAHNPLGLPAGTIITLTNTVPLPRNPSTFLYDGRDRIAATKAIVVTHAGWPVSPGPVFAGAVSVLATIDYGTNYISPVGQDLTNNLFKYVGLFVMAAQDGTSVTIDTDGSGPVAPVTVTLNQGESYLVNGGIKTGASVVASKPVQADLIIGHVGGAYAADWFTLYPVEQWSSAYYTPVATSASGNPAFVYLYNPNPTNITITYNTLVGSGSFSVPGTSSAYQFQMPKGSGAGFTSQGGAKFYALCTVGANPAADTSYNWGFTLLPVGGLTTEADVGWAPGSSDGTKDGSPVWVTPIGPTRIYVDYKGDHNGPLTDPNGNKYDTNYDLVALQSQKIYDPSKDQTGMRVYTLDGTLISAAWGEDPDVAAPGNPYIDAGTTVLPFPVPILTKTSTIVTDVPPVGLSIGDTLAYTVELDNKGLLPLGNTLVIDLPPTNLSYVTNSTTLNGTPISDNVSGPAFPLSSPTGYTIPVILRAGTSTFRYQAKVVGSGVISNWVGVAAMTASTDNTLTPNTNTSTINFTDSGGTTAASYAAGANIFVTLTDPGANTSSSSQQTVPVVVYDATDGDFETITLIETGPNTGVFRNTNGLPSSLSAGVSQEDGTLNVSAGDTLTVSFTDPIYGNSASASAMIQTPTLGKVLYLSSVVTTNTLYRVDPVAAGRTNTVQSVVLGSSGSSTIGAAATSRGFIANSTSLTLSHTPGTGPNRLLLVAVGVGATQATDTPAGGPVTGVTFGGVAMTRVTSVTNSPARSYIYSLINPPSGATNVVVSAGSASSMSVGATTFTNVNQTTPLGAAATNSAATGTTASVTVSSASGELVFSTADWDVGLVAQVVSPGAGQTQLWATNGNYTGAAASTKPGAASVTNTYTASNSQQWTIAAVPIKPASGGGGGGTNTVTFNQTPNFCQNFVMPAGGTVTITNYVTVTSGVGTMPANPAITATLKYGANIILTLSSPIYNSTVGTLVWSGTVASAVTNVAGQAFACTITNNQSGVTYTINYDSTNAPSKITLPTTTVIQITSLGVYDAPYPGGNLVTTPVAGTPLYVRATVSDPFGSYDITSLNLAITAPIPAANINATLTDANVVANTGCAKTYEYAWQTGATTGGYNVAMTANEGTEGITDVAVTSVTLTFLDLGTPSTTEFTSGNNGPATNAFPANSTVCMRVTDLDKVSEGITNINVTVTSSVGDSERVLLTETGTNTGVFTACLTTQTNGGSGSNNSILFAPVGSSITVSYTDPEDSSDQSSATATILPLPGIPGVAVNKTLISPVNGQALVGDTMQFNLQVVNVGSTTLTNVSLTDNFPSSSFSFQSAGLTPNIVTATALTWTNLGLLTPGQTTNISVSFTAIASAVSATNSATASVGATIGTGSASVSITKPALVVTKTLLIPTNGPVNIGSNVTFRIIVKNTGNTTIPTLPMEDTFSHSYLLYVSSTIPTNGSGSGSLLWTNLASAGPLATNTSITNDITMEVVGAGNPALNTATVDFAVDSNGDPVPASSSTVTNLVTGAAKITGFVYNDKDQSGTLTAGDVGLDGVTVQLSTDPNGDGDPADGSLVKITTTDTTGYYEFLNLTIGHYVIVETDLPGFISTAPVNNRIAVNITSLSTNANNNFFDYLPNPVVYATISGTVWNDTNGFGTNYVGEPGVGNVSLDLVQDVNGNGLADNGEPVVASTTTGTNGVYTFQDITPGNYVIRESDLYGYYSTGDTRPPNDNQIGLVITAGLVTNKNDFFDRLEPIAVNDTASALYFTPTKIYPLINDTNFYGDALIITNAVTANGIVTINAGGTNLTFTPTNTGPPEHVYH